MRSRFADKFNHDDEAQGYDLDVADEDNPIREGYSALLDWVAKEASPGEESSVLELGTGTGNLTVLLGRPGRLVCVDVSEEMLRIAHTKLSGLDGVEYMVSDLLEIFDRLRDPFDLLVSTYAIHHLTAEEKSLLFHRIAEGLAPGGRAVFGDLMFADSEHRREYLAGLRRSQANEHADEIEDEFFWDLERSVAELIRLGFEVETERISELSWGVSAVLGNGSPDLLY